MGGEEGGRCRVGSVGKDEEGGCGIGRGHREMTQPNCHSRQTPALDRTDQTVWSLYI